MEVDMNPDLQAPHQGDKRILLEYFAVLSHRFNSLQFNVVSVAIIYRHWWSLTLSDK